MTASKSYQPVKLLKNVSYPTYQLYAVIKNKKIKPEVALKIAILETMSWLRKRFRELEIPDEINLPEPVDYKEVNENDFKSFHINEGYVLDVVYIKKYGIWSLRLIESDLGPEPGKQIQKRKPVPGRTFQTNIAFIIKNGQLECGFKTLCLEPEGTNVPCEVFRLAVVKSIVRNEMLGLKQVYPIIEEAHYIDSITKIKKLNRFIKDENRQMPLVILSEYTEKMDLPKIENKFLNTNYNYKNWRDNLLYEYQDVEPEHKNKLPFEADKIIKYRMGYAQFVIIEKEKIKDFNYILNSDYSISEGDVRIIYPLSLNGGTELYKLEDIIQNKVLFKGHLAAKLQDYPKGKDINFGNVKFLNEARIIEQDEIIKNSNSKKEAVKANEIKLESLKQIYQENIGKLEREIEDKDILISKLRNKINQKEEKLKSLDKLWENKNKEIRSKYNKEINVLKKEIKRKNQLLGRPTKPEDIPLWVDNHFSDRLIFHKKAQNLIRKTSVSEVDMVLLCDAIEFLACEYYDYTFGQIGKEEMNTICSRKYDRPFDVGSSGDLSIYKYPKEYKIKYGQGYTGKPVEMALNMHLKVGKDNENLLRIYFLIDREKKLIVVGSLPKHLPTISYK